MEFHIGIPQLIYIGLTIAGIGISSERHGKPKTGNYSFWEEAFPSVIIYGLLYWGGFFTK